MEFSGQTDLQAFRLFVDERFDAGSCDHSLDEAVAEFREYQAQLSKLRDKVRLSDQDASKHGVTPLTDEEMLATFAELDAEFHQEEIRE